MDPSGRYVARILLFTQDRCQRCAPRVPKMFRCPVRIGGELLDCCIMFETDGSPSLGAEYDANVEFLSPAIAEEVTRKSRIFEIMEPPKVIGVGMLL